MRPAASSFFGDWEGEEVISERSGIQVRFRVRD